MNVHERKLLRWCSTPVCDPRCTAALSPIFPLKQSLSLFQFKASARVVKAWQRWGGGAGEFVVADVEGSEVGGAVQRSDTIAMRRLTRLLSQLQEGGGRGDAFEGSSIFVQLISCGVLRGRRRATSSQRMTCRMQVRLLASLRHRNVAPPFISNFSQRCRQLSWLVEQQRR